MQERNGVLWFNPGSAGPRRFQLPIALGRLTIEAGRARGEILDELGKLTTEGRRLDGELKGIYEGLGYRWGT